MRVGVSTLLYFTSLLCFPLSLSNLPNILLGSRVCSWGRKKQVSLIEEKRFFYFLLGLLCPDQPWSNYCRFWEWERSNHYSFFPSQMINYHIYYSKPFGCIIVCFCSLIKSIFEKESLLPKTCPMFEASSQCLFFNVIRCSNAESDCYSSGWLSICWIKVNNLN